MKTTHIAKVNKLKKNKKYLSFTHSRHEAEQITREIRIVKFTRTRTFTGVKGEGNHPTVIIHFYNVRGDRRWIKRYWSVVNPDVQENRIQDVNGNEISLHLMED